MKKYNKLIRDKVPANIIKKGEAVKFHIADEAEYWAKLKEKLLEEAKEYQKDEELQDIVDLLEVIAAIAKYKKIKPSQLVAARKKKAREKGLFKKRIILDES